MIVWMRKHARTIGKDLRSSAEGALAAGTTGALVGMAFFAVIREGLETVVFLLAAFQSATNPTSAGFGALLGVLCAVAIGVAIYRGGVKLNLTRFFRFTGIVLVFVAAGLVASALHTAHEAGWLNFGQAAAFELDWLVVPGTWTAALLTGMLGLQPYPGRHRGRRLPAVRACRCCCSSCCPTACAPSLRRGSMQPRDDRDAARPRSAGVLLVACGSRRRAGRHEEARARRRCGCRDDVRRPRAGLLRRVVDSAGTMRRSIEQFLDKPGKATARRRAQGVARRARRLRRRPRRSASTAARSTTRDGPEGQINAWPMDEAYVDYVDGNRAAGHRQRHRRAPDDHAPTCIVEANEQGGETNISTGWHAIEFLLWGQDRSKTGPGARPASDYTTRAQRRPPRQYLRLATELLRADLRACATPGPSTGGNFRAAFLADPDSALRPDHPRHRRADARRAGRRADGRRARERATRRTSTRASATTRTPTSSTTSRGSAMSTSPSSRASRGPSLDSLVADRDPELPTSCAPQIDGSARRGAGVPGDVRDDHRARPTARPSARRWATRSRIWRRRRDMLEDVAEAARHQGRLRGVSRRRADRRAPAVAAGLPASRC